MLPDEVSKPFSARMPFRLSGIENGRLRTEAEDSVLVVVVVFSGVFGINIDIHSVAHKKKMVKKLFSSSFLSYLAVCEVLRGVTRPSRPRPSQSIRRL